MNKKQYLAKRAQLMNEAQALIDAGKAAEAEEKMKEITALDEQWDAIAQAQANFKALNHEPVAMLPVALEGALEDDAKSEKKLEKAWASEEYKTAWAKTLMGKTLTSEEQSVYDMVNEDFTHTTGNTGIVIPKTVSRGIWEKAAEMYPYFADVTKTYVDGVLSMIQENTSSDAGWYEEDKESEDGKEEFKEFTLKGCELSRSITVSWKLKEMAIEDFIPYIQRKMAKKMGAAAGYGATHGKGTAIEGKPEPIGTVTALLSEKNTPQVVRYEKDSVPTYDHILQTRAKIKSGYASGLKIYANGNTIWTKLAGIVDKNGRPIFVPDPTGNGKIRILGMVVEEDDSMSNGEVLFSNANEGYHMNINKEMSMMTEEHVKKRKTEYCGYAIMDGNIVTSDAHALLTDQGDTASLANTSKTKVAANTSETEGAKVNTSETEGTNA